jgi:hypothetical protein
MRRSRPALVPPCRLRPSLRSWRVPLSSDAPPQPNQIGRELLREATTSSMRGSPTDTFDEPPGASSDRAPNRRNRAIFRAGVVIAASGRAASCRYPPSQGHPISLTGVRSDASRAAGVARLRDGALDALELLAFQALSIRAHLRTQRRRPRAPQGISPAKRELLRGRDGGHGRRSWTPAAGGCVCAGAGSGGHAPVVAVLVALRDRHSSSSAHPKASAPPRSPFLLQSGNF